MKKGRLDPRFAVVFASAALLFGACAVGVDDDLDTAVTDSGTPQKDSGNADTGPRDSGANDTGSGPTDTGTTPVDTGVADAGTPDTGPADTGTPDTGGAGCTDTLLINEVLTTGAGDDTGYEWVEIYNPNSCAKSFASYKLVYRSADGTTDGTLFNGATNTLTVPAGGYSLIGSATVSGTNGTLANGMKDTGGSVGIVFNTTRIDTVGWGAAIVANSEVKAAPAPPEAQSIARTPNGRDTNNNFNDFKVVTTPTPGRAN